MLTYNRPQKIGRAIASACRQTLDDWELIIVQDGANPATAALLGDWVEREPRVRYFQRGTVGCIAEASNYGLRHARGQYVAILDDDDCWSTEDKLERQIAFLDANPEYVACGGGYILVDQDGSERGRFLKPESDDAIRARALLANPIANSTAIFRRTLAGEPALYDESIKGFADWDFWLMIGEHGKLYNFPEHVAHYALWEGGGSFHSQKVNTRAAVRIVKKHSQHYDGGAAALALAYLYLAYAHLPLSVRRASYHTLSSLKKALASAPATPPAAARS